MNNEYRPIGKYISILYRHAQAYIAHQLKPYDLGSGQYTYLLMLYQKDGVSQEELSKQLMIDKGTTARAIEKLEKLGYVIRKTNPADRRSNIVFLTDKGKSIRTDLCKTICEWNDILLADLDNDEKTKIDDVLGKMVNSTMNFFNK